MSSAYLLEYVACGVLYKMNWLLELTLWGFFFIAFLYFSAALQFVEMS